MNNDLVEVRWAHDASLQYRSKQPVADASGAICGFVWGPWRDVKTADQQSFGDLADSGGIAEAP